MKTVAIYARYSTDLQNDTSTEDQIRICRERAEANGWTVDAVYEDRAISGATLMRPGVQQLLMDAEKRKFNVIMSEALDRVSRSQADIAQIYQRLEFLEIDLYTLSEGKVGLIEVGLKGMMNQMFLQETANKVRRGLRGRVEAGKSAGGLPYGYKVVKAFDEKGEPITGEREIDIFAASVINRIFRDYAAGLSPKAISKALNEEQVPGPTGKGWTASTINGNRKRGIGILNNEMYIGTLVWNRQRFIKDPRTGKRVPRFNPESEWLRREIPELRIVEQELWDKAKERQAKLTTSKDTFWTKQRPKYLLSGLIKCGKCGGGCSKASHGRYGCSNHRNKGTCDNKLRIDQHILEEMVIGALRDHLMDPEMVDIFTREYLAHQNRLRSDQTARLSAAEAELKRVTAEKEKMIQSIIDGVPGHVVKDKLIEADNRETELKEILSNTEPAPALIHPRMADRYREEVLSLIQSLNEEDQRAEAADILRGLVDKVVLTPSRDNRALEVTLHGDLAGIISLATKGEKGNDISDLDLNVFKLVAEEG